MNLSKYVNVVAVGFLLYAIYGLMGDVSSLIYPAFKIPGASFSYYKNQSKVEIATKQNVNNKKSECKDCATDLSLKEDRSIDDEYVDIRHDSLVSVLNNLYIVFVVFLYFMFGCRLIFLGENEKNINKRETIRKPTYRRISRN